MINWKEQSKQAKRLAEIIRVFARYSLADWLKVKQAYAYPIALGVMTLVGLGMYHFFRKTGWLD